MLTRKQDEPGHKSRIITVTKVLGALFIVVGGVKLIGLEMVEQRFLQWGYPAWFMIVIGAIETISGILLLTRSMAWLGALTVSFVMLGAIATHIRAGEWFMVVLPLLVLGTAMLVLKNQGALYRQRRNAQRVSGEPSDSAEDSAESRQQFSSTTNRT